MDNVTTLYDGTDNAYVDICDAIHEIVQKYDLDEEQLFFSLSKYLDLLKWQMWSEDIEEDD